MCLLDPAVAGTFPPRRGSGWVAFKEAVSALTVQPRAGGVRVLLTTGFLGYYAFFKFKESGDSPVDPEPWT